MFEMIGNVKLNFDYYSGEDFYNDGDIEDEILKIIENNINVFEVLNKDDRWPIVYHLSPQRRNLLEWYEFEKNSRALEIGAGCGALTGFLCEKVEKVVAVELSKRRANIIANRCKDFNLEIIVGNLNDIKIDEKFDYITLIGVLEYASKYTNTVNPFLDFLQHVDQFLKKDGILIIAIENKFGLKYWSGAKEDHTGNYFESIEGYINNDEVKTFSKAELSELLKKAGYKNLEFYYPLPDYKLPTQIFSDIYKPTLGQIVRSYPNYDRDRITLFNEKIVYENLILNNSFDFFANSFLVFAKV